MANNWQPTADLEILKRRAQYLTAVRLFFAERNVLEVETPVLSPAAPTAPYLDSFQTDYIPIGTTQAQPYYLQTSPEFAMKRLLASGLGSIYQIAKVFRNGELGRLHSPEFTMIEWYRTELDLDQLMSEVADLLSQAFGFKSVKRVSYQSVFQHYLDLDVFNSSDQIIKQTADKMIPSLAADLQLDRNGYLELLMSEVIELQLTEMAEVVFIYDFPSSQAQLAKIKTDDSGQSVAARFEVYAGGMELANGYDECIDANELRRRFEADNLLRKSQNKPEMPIDENLLNAMESGLPQCTGVALGFDRLLMLKMAKPSVNDVQSFNDFN